MYYVCNACMMHVCIMYLCIMYTLCMHACMYVCTYAIYEQLCRNMDTYTASYIHVRTYIKDIASETPITPNLSLACQTTLISFPNFQSYSSLGRGRSVVGSISD